MTDEERQEAKRAWVDFVLSRVNYPKPEGWVIWEAAYAAACQAKRDEYSDSHRYRKALTDLKTERARSAKLVEALEFMTMPLNTKAPTIESLLETIANDDRVGLAALAEYEAGRD